MKLSTSTFTFPINTGLSHSYAMVSLGNTHLHSTPPGVGSTHRTMFFFFNLMSCLCCPELTASYQWCKRVWQCQLIWVSLPSSLSTDALEQGTSSWCSGADRWRARGDRLVQLSSVAMNEQNEWEAEHSTYSMCIMYSADIPLYKFYKQVVHYLIWHWLRLIF